MRLLYLACLIGQLFLNSCATRKGVSGTYISNFAVNGFFVTKIKIKEDSTLEYRYWGDMNFDTATAYYKVDGNKLVLTYYPIQLDTTLWSELRKHGGDEIIKEEINRYGRSAPMALIFKRDKLFLYDKDGRLIKRKTNAKNKKRRFYLAKV